MIARPDLSAQQAQTLSESIAQIIADNGGSVSKVEYWGLRNLTYRIKKNRKGHYLHFNLDAAAACIEELERQERIHEDVLRYLTVRVEELDPNPSQIMVAKSSREERGRRDDGYRRDRDDRGPREDRPRGDRDEPRRERREEEVA
ncbi:MAG TPA: 30S ribosomal protein S6 [Geminicoccus sp.]|nr:30S ribosomal protein S6 [Geminicoccus sp.]HWL71686.1 30S ribosomal protein S6 [Geminicoccus sp.]